MTPEAQANARHAAAEAALTARGKEPPRPLGASDMVIGIR